MTSLPPQDIALIEESKEHLEFMKEIDCTYWETGTSDGFGLLSIISRQQKALEKAIEQRDEMASKALHTIYQNDFWLYANKEIQAILDGEK